MAGRSMPLEELSVIDYGDLAFDYAKIAEFPDALTAHIRGILAAGAGTVTLGGDHYITLSDPAGLCREVRAGVADPFRRPFRHLAG